jgi:hypothetical protein
MEDLLFCTTTKRKSRGSKKISGAEKVYLIPAWKEFDKHHDLEK